MLVKSKNERQNVKYSKNKTSNLKFSEQKVNLIINNFCSVKVDGTLVEALEFSFTLKASNTFVDPSHLLQLINFQSKRSYNLLI